MVSCLSKFNKQLKMIRGGYKLVGYTVNDIDSSSSLNPLMDSISYRFSPHVETSIGDEYESTISFKAPPIAYGWTSCALQSTGTDSLRIFWGDLQSITYNSANHDLRIGPFFGKNSYVSKIINTDENKLFVRGFYNGKVYQYNLIKTSK